MARAGLLALAEQEARHESGDARVDMDDGSAGEVEDLERALEVALGVDVDRAHEAVRPPDPVGDRRIDEDRPQADEPQHRRELHAFRERACDERRRDDRERHLEHHVDGFRDRRRQRIGIVRPARQVIVDALEKDPREAAYECAAAGERQAVGENEVDHRDQRRDGEARHHGVADVLLADHAAIEEPEARDGHHQDERDRGQKPGRVAGIAGALFESRSPSSSAARRGCRSARAAAAAAAPRRRRRRRRRSGRSGVVLRQAAGAARPINMAVASAAARPVNIRGSFMVLDSEMVVEGAWRLKRVLVLLARADPHRRVEVVDEDLAVADLAGARRGDDRFDHLVGDVRVDRDFDFQLGKETHGVFRPAIDFGMPLLSPVALDLRNRQTVHPDGGERIAHLLQFERLYDRHYDFHKPRPIVTRRGGTGPTAFGGEIGTRCAPRREAPYKARAMNWPAL